MEARQLPMGSIHYASAHISKRTSSAKPRATMKTNSSAAEAHLCFELLDMFLLFLPSLLLHFEPSIKDNLV